MVEGGGDIVLVQQRRVAIVLGPLRAGGERDAQSHSVTEGELKIGGVRGRARCADRSHPRAARLRGLAYSVAKSHACRDQRQRTAPEGPVPPDAPNRPFALAA